jgi:hypothetical protein
MAKNIRNSLFFWVLLAYAGMLFAFLGWQTFHDAQKKRELRGFYLQHALRVSKPLLRDGRTRELLAYLREAAEMGLVDFYELEQTGKPTEAGGLGPLEKPVLAEPVSEVNGWVWGKAETAEATLRLGNGTNWRARFGQAWAREAERLPADGAFLFLVAVLSLLFRDVSGRPNAVKGAAGPAREGRRAKLLRAERAAQSVEPTSGEAVFGRAALLRSDKEDRHSELKTFFADCASLVSRYGGKAGTLHGHEILFYFVDGEPRHQARLALALTRDLEKLALSQGLTLTVALASGRLEVAQFLNNQSLFGAPVEETAELLRGLQAQKKPGVKFSDSVQALHKQKNAAQAIEKVLDECKGGKSAELAYHRSDESLAATLRSLASEEWEREAYVGTMNELRHLQCRRCGIELLEAFRYLLGVELERKDSYRLSATLALAPHLLTRTLVDKPLEQMFLQAVKVKDRRVRANAVDVFTKFFPEREIPELRSMIRDEDNRVSANALIKAACERFDEKVIARVEERVKGGSVAHVASALHAMGEIASYYKRTDPLFLGSKIAFLRLFDGIPDWVQHPNPMIRRQALIAAHKLASPEVESHLHQLFQRTTDPELLSLFATVYGWKRREQKQAA